MSNPKRTAKRFPMQLPVTVKYSNGGVHADSGRTENVSFGGIYFETSAKLMAGDKVELVLPVPAALCADGNGWVRCWAKVVWVESRQNGIMGVGAAVETYEVMPSQA